MGTLKAMKVERTKGIKRVGQWGRRRDIRQKWTVGDANPGQPAAEHHGWVRRPSP
ncbi:hypothetical protein SESBI_08360 [Sesbania bispinosa]|nr:hypothetical protein SESBI_08360 [Sesbania bispinosa]